MGCTCDEPGEGPCPEHARENELQDELIKCREELKNANQKINDLKMILALLKNPSWR